MRKAQSRAVIDHLVFGCEQLETGTAYLESVIGKDFVFGGKHDLMTTHNKLLRLQDSIYLESIAIDHKAAKAKGELGRKRWFSLDDTLTRQKLVIAPYPLTWVVAVDNVDEAVARCGYNPGRTTKMTRENFAWSLTVPDDGGLTEQGLLPSFIKWPSGLNPANQLPENGTTLQKIVLVHPQPDFISAAIDRVGIEDFIEVRSGSVELIFKLKTSAGKLVSFSNAII
jgi:hypothetical protein